MRQLAPFGKPTPTPLTLAHQASATPAPPLPAPRVEHPPPGLEVERLRLEIYPTSQLRTLFRTVP